MTGSGSAIEDEVPAGRADAPEPDVRLVEGTADIDDPDAFLGDLRRIGEETGTVVQAFDADLIVSATQLREAARLAARALARDEAVARDPAVEILLYTAGRRQIDRALELGVSAGPTRIVVAVADLDPAGASPVDLDEAVDAVGELLEPTETLGSVDERAVREYYDVTDRELAATDGDLAAVVRERVALLDVEK